MIKNARTLTTCAAAVVALSTVPASAAPVMSHAKALKLAVASDVMDVSWRGRRVGAGVAAGLAFGALAGAAIAASPRSYDPYYAVPAYGPYYGYAPVYGYGPVYRYGYDYPRYGYDRDCVIRGVYGRRDYSEC